jgi:hypothetical protein
MHFRGVAEQIVLPLFVLLSACGSGVTSEDGAAVNPAALSTSSPRYTYQIVDVPGATSTRAWAINDLGVTAGNYSDANGVQHAFIRSPTGRVITVDVPGGVTGFHGINNKGVAVGIYTVETPAGPNAVAYHGFERAPDGSITIVDFPGAADSGLFGINNRGDVVGGDDLGDQSVGGSFVLSRGHFTALQDPPGSVPFNVGASGINDLGVVSGSFLGVDGNTHAFLLRGATYTTFDDIGATVTALKGLNDRGQSVGVSDVGGGFVFDTFTLSISARIACPDGHSTFPEGINNWGQIAGRCKLNSDGPQGPFHAFVAIPLRSDD